MEVQCPSNTAAAQVGKTQGKWAVGKWAVDKWVSGQGVNGQG